MTPRTQEIMATTDKWDYDKSKYPYPAKEASSEETASRRKGTLPELPFLTVEPHIKYTGEMEN